MERTGKTQLPTTGEVCNTIFCPTQREENLETLIALRSLRKLSAFLHPRDVFVIQMLKHNGVDSADRLPVTLISSTCCGNNRINLRYFIKCPFLKETSY